MKANNTNQKEALWLRAWYENKGWVYGLLPVEWLFRGVAWLRRWWLIKNCQTTLTLPIVVVGNISVGGTGKTPLIIAMVKHLEARGYTVGVVSRGYGSCAPEYPYLITQASTTIEASDEPLHIWQATGCQVCIDANRVAAAELLQKNGCDILLSDDGLQHYRLDRALEIVVVDAARGFGNGHCLPVGPLREPRSRLKTVDFIIANQNSLNEAAALTEPHYSMRMQPQRWYSVKTLEPKPLDFIAPGTQVHAVAGVGNPQRFFNTLASLKIYPECHVYQDHHKFSASDFQFTLSKPIVMTTKDAVKCQSFASPSWLALEVSAIVDKRFWFDFDTAITALLKQKG